MTTTESAIHLAIILISFCAMIIDGKIVPEEQVFGENIITKLAPETDAKEYLKYFTEMANADSEGLIRGYFSALQENELNAEEKIELLLAADKMIQADGKIEEKEIQFFNLTISQLDLTEELIIRDLPNYKNDYATEKQIDLNEFLQQLNLPAFELNKE